MAVVIVEAYAVGCDESRCPRYGPLTAESRGHALTLAALAGWYVEGGDLPPDLADTKTRCPDHAPTTKATRPPTFLASNRRKPDDPN